MTVNPHQFKLFYGASELKSAINRSYDVDPGEGDTDLNSMWERKLAESKRPERKGHHGSGVYESLTTEGVRPSTDLEVEWSTPSPWEPDEPGIQIPEGHHRVASAADIEEKTGRAMWFNVHHYDYGLEGRLRKGLKPMHSGLPEAQGIRRGPPIGAQFGEPKPVGLQQKLPITPSLADKLKIWNQNK